MPNPNHALRQAREMRGLSQQKVALALNTTPKNIGRWERGETVPTPYFREQLCQLFAMDAQKLGFIPVSFPDNTEMAALHPRNTFIDPALPRLPLPTTHLVGREQIVMELLTHLQKGEDCILTGLPGVGKTTLAQLVSIHPLRETFFPDGVLWISLGQDANLSSEIRRLTTLFHMSPDVLSSSSTLDHWSYYLHQYIADRRLLLIIDDIWEVEAVYPFLLGGLRAAHLFTTRLPKVAYAFPTGKIFSVSELDDLQSYTLLLTLVPQVEQCNPEIVQRALSVCGGLPFAIEMLGRQVRIQAIGGQRRRIEAALEHLSHPSYLHHAQITPMQKAGITFRSLEATIRMSDQYLPSITQNALRMLSMLPSKPDTFSEAEALAACQQDLSVLDCLIDAGLLETAGQGRYMLHRTIADFARLHLYTDASLIVPLRKEAHSPSQQPAP